MYGKTRTPASYPLSAIYAETPLHGRRDFLKAASLAGAAAIGGRGIEPKLGLRGDHRHTASASTTAGKIDGVQKKSAECDGRKVEFAEGHLQLNNYYEFSTDKYEPAERAKNFKTRPGP